MYWCTLLIRRLLTHPSLITTRQSEWMKPNARLSVKIVATPECMSVGDALRELDARQLITTDFILTTGELISNIKLDKVLEEHRARKKTDKNSIMTMLLKEASRTHSARYADIQQREWACQLTPANAYV